MPAIDTEALTKDYALGFWRKRPYRALDRLTLTVEEGETFGFLGPNGAGKSTTLKLLMGLIVPTSGSARILDRPIADLVVRRRIGFLPENPTFYDHLTGEELLEYFAALSGVSTADRRQRVRAVLDEVGIDGERHMRLRTYSKGMIQRLGVAQAIVAQPDLVFLDEPMSGLDPIGRRDLRQLMLRLRDRGCTVFFSSHILADAEALCSRVAVVAKGRLVAQGAIPEIVAFEQRGWELVVSHLPAALEASLRLRTRSITRLSDHRFTVELPADAPTALWLQELSSQGVNVLSLNPIRTTLEEYFVAKVGDAAPRATDGNRV